jgi:hypothetical protein
MVMMVVMMMMTAPELMTMIMMMMNVFLHELYYGPELVWFQQSDMMIMFHDDVGDADDADWQFGKQEKELSHALWTFLQARPKKNKADGRGAQTPLAETR